MPDKYDLTTARGGKDDAAIEEALRGKWDALRRGDRLQIGPYSLRRSHWTGKDRVDIQSGHADFLNRNDHTRSPVPIKATVRVLHKNGFRGIFQIEVSPGSLLVQRG